MTHVHDHAPERACAPSCPAWVPETPARPKLVAMPAPPSRAKGTEPADLYAVLEQRSREGPSPESVIVVECYRNADGSYQFLRSAAGPLNIAEVYAYLGIAQQMVVQEMNG